MTTTAWALLACFLVVAPLNWLSRWYGVRWVELVTKPTATALLVGVALTSDPAADDVRTALVVALVASLVGDVLLLGDSLFIAGLVAFLAAHVAYVAGFLLLDTWHWWYVAASAVPIVLVALVVGRPILSSTRTRGAPLRVGVRVYLVVILAMFACACGAGDATLVAGAALFVVSDSLLGWRQFVAVHDTAPLRTGVMVTYHLAQLLLTLSLVG